MIRRPPRSTQSRSSAASDVYKRQLQSPALAEVQCDFVCELAVAGVQVDVVGNQELARANDRGAEPRVEPRWPRVGRPRGVLQFSFEPLVFARPDVRQAATRLGRSGVFVEVHRQPQLVRDPPADPARAVSYTHLTLPT